MILEVVKTLKFRGHGIVSKGAIFDSSERTIPAFIKAEFKSGSGNVRQIDQESSPPPQEQKAVPQENPQPATDNSSEASPSSESGNGGSKSKVEEEKSSTKKAQPSVKRRTLKKKGK